MAQLVHQAPGAACHSIDTILAAPKNIPVTAAKTAPLKKIIYWHKDCLIIDSVWSWCVASHPTAFRQLKPMPDIKYTR